MAQETVIAHIDALKAADELPGEAMQTVTDAIESKPLIDWELADLGRAMTIASAIKRQADRAVRLLEEEQARRIAEISAAGKLERIDGGHAWFVKNPAPKPSIVQMIVLQVFELSCARGDAQLLTDCYDLCVSIGAHITSWRAKTGESLDVAYRRRLSELEAK